MESTRRSLGREVAIAGSISTVSNRVRACKTGKLAEAGSKQRPLTEIEMERDIKKK